MGRGQSTRSGSKIAVAEYVARPGEGAAVQDKREVKTPRRYRVLLHNDDYTTMQFVVEILETVFSKPHGEAVRIMLDVHENGMGVAGVYVKVIAEAKVTTVQALARDEGYPLRCSMSPE